MRAIASKITGNSYPADIYNSMRDELENTVLSTDQTLDIEAGPDTDLNMLGKAAALYGGASDYYQDSGSVNTYVLSHSTNLKSVPAYKDGLGVIFKASVMNTGASTLNVSSLGAVALVDELGNALVGGEVSTSYYNIARYDNGSSKFQLVSRTGNSNTKNSVIDGDMRVGTGAVATISAAFQHGQCPLVEVLAVGPPSAGSIQQSESIDFDTTNFSCVALGVTTGATGAIWYRYRIESKDARRFIGKAAIIHCKVYHNKGSSIDYTLSVNKADAEDDFTTATNIGTSSLLPVLTGTSTQVSFYISDMGACGNGIELSIKAGCGAVTTKDFHITELTLQQGTVISPFESKSIATVEAEVHRYFERWECHPSAATPIDMGLVTNSTQASFYLNMVEKRDTPTITVSGISTFQVIGGGITGTIVSIPAVESTKKLVRIYTTVSGSPWTPWETARLSFEHSVGAFIQFDARL